MRETDVAIWVGALRSGAYEQGTGTLLRWDEGRDREEFCCLGVCGNELIKSTWNADRTDMQHFRDKEAGKIVPFGITVTYYLGRQEGTLSRSQLKLVGLTEEEQQRLTDLNDNLVPFTDIAWWIEKFVNRDAPGPRFDTAQALSEVAENTASVLIRIAKGQNIDLVVK